MTEVTARVDELRRDGVRLLAGTIVDNAGVLRTKSVPAARLQAAVTSGVGLSPVFAVMCVDGFITSGGGYGGPVGDMRLVPDLDAAAILAPEVGLAWAPMNQHDQELAVMETCQRSVLRRWQDRAEAAGHRYLMGLECEFTVFRPTPDGPVPAHAGPAYGLAALLDLEDFATDAVQELERVGVGVEQFHPEYGPGQMEVSLSPAVPVTAIDQYLLTRIMLRRTARRHGLQVSYAPVTAAPDDLPAEVRHRAGIRRLPADLGAALDNLRQSRLLRDALGDALIDAFVAVRRYELSTYAGRPLGEVVPLMRWVY